METSYPRMKGTQYLPHTKIVVINKNDTELTKLYRNTTGNQNAHIYIGHLRLAVVKIK